MLGTVWKMKQPKPANAKHGKFCNVSLPISNWYAVCPMVCPQMRSGMLQWCPVSFASDYLEKGVCANRDIPIPSKPGVDHSGNGCLTNIFLSLLLNQRHREFRLPAPMLEERMRRSRRAPVPSPFLPAPAEAAWSHHLWGGRESKVGTEISHCLLPFFCIRNNRDLRCHKELWGHWEVPAPQFLQALVAGDSHDSAPLMQALISRMPSRSGMQAAGMLLGEAWRRWPLGGPGTQGSPLCLHNSVTISQAWHHTWEFDGSLPSACGSYRTQ